MLLLHCLSDAHSRYSHYLAAILRLEGFADFAEADLATVDPTLLARHDLLLLPRFSPTAEQADWLEAYVVNGGKLIALMPDAHLARRFGVDPTWRTIDNGWLQPNAEDATLAGLCCEPIQIVTPALGWIVGEAATILGWATPGAQPEGKVPALVRCPLGKGEAILVSYDLAQAVARLRQGNPEHADLAYAGLDGIFRPSELFVGQMGEGQMLLPQADLHTALLARLVETLAPRPRLWYYPQASQQSVIIMTSDDDWSSLDQFEILLAGLRKRQATCTFYVVPETHLTRSLMDRWEGEGHSFSVHPALADDIRTLQVKAEPQVTQVPGMLRQNVERHQAQFGRGVQTIRQHAVRWLGYVEAARLLADLGVQMETNYISVHPFPLGYMAGSGRPLPFVDTTGEIIPVYQQPTHWTEEVLIHPGFVFSFKWSVAKALDVVGKILQRAAHEFYTPICFNSHPVSFATYSSPLIEGSWDRALAQGMTILSADAWLAWTQARNGVQIEAQDEGWLVRSNATISSLTLLFPASAKISAAQATTQEKVLWGQRYTVLELKDLSAQERRWIKRERTS
ncbi:MAG: hypothetical protein U0175_11710 [Caldilineaceae bacterium]